MDWSRSAHTRVTSDAASHPAMISEVIPEVSGWRLRALGDVNLCGRLVQMWAAQHQYRVLGAGVNSLGDSSVHGRFAVGGDEDELDTGRLWEVRPGTEP